MGIVDLDGNPPQEFYVSIGIHWDGKKTRTTVRGFKEGTSYEYILRFLRFKGSVVEDQRLGKVIQLQGDRGMDVANLLVNYRIANWQQIDVLEFDDQYRVIRKLR